MSMLINKLNCCSTRTSWVLYSASLFFSTKTQTQSSSYTKKSKLYDQIVNIEDPKASIKPLLDQWVNEGNTVRKSFLQSLVKLMKDQNRFNHALQISDWMTDRLNLTLSPAKVVDRLKLIYRAHGSAQLEMYFDKLSDKRKSREVYFALLTCYVQDNSVQKAEAVMQEIREKGMATLCFPYNILIKLYARVGEFEKIDILIQEMERKRVVRGTNTMINLMSAYVAASNISGMERILNLVENNPQISPDWRVYAAAASGYLKLGLIEKALTMLRKFEDVMPLEKRTSAFDDLLTLYGKAGKKDELYLVWNTYKPLVEVKRTSFMRMISSLLKLDDINGAEKIFQEWESKCTSAYDYRVLGPLLSAYCSKGLMEKAEAVVEKAAKGRTIYARTWNVLAMGYVEHNQMSKAVEMLKRAISVSGKGWRPNPRTLTACLDYLQEQGDVEGVEEINMSLKRLELLMTNTCRG